MMKQAGAILPIVIAVVGADVDEEDLQPVQEIVRLLPSLGEIVGKFDFLEASLSVTQEGTESGTYFRHVVIYVRPAAETVDAIVAMAMAISRSAPLFRDGPRIVQELRSLSFEGVSGFVEFTEEGDRKNPQFSVLNGQSGTRNGVNWTDVGSTGTDIGSTIIEGSVCFAVDA